MTYSVLGSAVFARQLCLPVPALLFLISAGGLARNSGLSLSAILAVSVLACLAGDFVWFEAGRLWGSRILRLFTGLSLNPKGARERATEIFARYGLPCLLVSKFVPGLDGITPPLAGLEGVRRTHFALFDGLGAFIWSSFYVLIGVFFSKSVQAILSFLATSGRVILLIAGLPALIWMVWRGADMVNTLRRLKARRISPRLLNLKLQREPGSTVLIDLLGFQDEIHGGMGIEGAVRLDPDRLRNHRMVTNRQDVSFVLYCAHASEYRSARIAMELRRKGIRNVWVLEGGLAEWTKASFPLSDCLLSEDAAIERFGFSVAGPVPRTVRLRGRSGRPQEGEL